MGVIVRQKGKGGPGWLFLNHQGKRRSKLVGDKHSVEVIDRLDDVINREVFLVERKRTEC